MPGNARMNDMFIGICCCHAKPPCRSSSGIIITASPNVMTENMGQARMGDIGIGFCGHSTTIVSASPTVMANNLGVARLGDTVAGCINGSIITAAGSVMSNG